MRANLEDICCALRSTSDDGQTRVTLTEDSKRFTYNLHTEGQHENTGNEDIRIAPGSAVRELEPELV
jgi:hypothetical protein